MIEDCVMVIVTASRGMTSEVAEGRAEAKLYKNDPEPKTSALLMAAEMSSLKVQLAGPWPLFVQAEMLDEARRSRDEQKGRNTARSHINEE